MCILTKKNFADDKKILFILIDFLCQTEILLLNMLKLLEIQGFSRFFFCINCQIPDFLVVFVQNSRFFQVYFKISQTPSFSR